VPVIVDVMSKWNGREVRMYVNGQSKQYTDPTNLTLGARNDSIGSQLRKGAGEREQNTDDMKENLYTLTCSLELWRPKSENRSERSLRSRYRGILPRFTPNGNIVLLVVIYSEKQQGEWPNSAPLSPTSKSWN
jgi:hypothetical protein